jgi:hypothetical protein
MPVRGDVGRTTTPSRTQKLLLGVDAVPHHPVGAEVFLYRILKVFKIQTVQRIFVLEQLSAAHVENLAEDSIRCQDRNRWAYGIVPTSGLTVVSGTLPPGRRDRKLLLGEDLSRKSPPISYTLSIP